MSEADARRARSYAQRDYLVRRADEGRAEDAARKAGERGGPDGELTIKAAGQILAGWTSVNVTRGVERMPSDFDIAATVKFPGELREGIPVGSPLQVLIGPHVIITGYLERLVIRLSAQEHTVNFIGRGRCCDLVDAAAILDSMTRQGTSVGTLATELVKPFKGPIQVLTPDGDGDGKTFTFSISLGESPFEIISRIARYEGLLTYEDRDGNLVLARVGKQQHSSGFTEGRNVQSIETFVSQDERFSVYIPLLFSSDTLTGRVEGEGQGNTAGKPTEDKGVTRYRPRIVVSEQNVGEEFYAAKRALWEATRRIGRSYRVTLVADSWVDSKGLPWTPNMIAPVKAPTLKLDAPDWVITEVNYRRNGQSGTTTTLTLMPPEALTVEPSLLSAGEARFLVDRPTPTGSPTATPAPVSAPNAGADFNPRRGDGPGL